MTAICPKDCKPCCDDLCQGGRCILTGSETFERCPRCHQIFGGDIDCDCGPDEEYYDELDEPGWEEA